MKTITIDGVQLTADDIAAMRETVIGWRDESTHQWPEAIDFTVAATWLIGLLSAVVEQYPEQAP